MAHRRVPLDKWVSRGNSTQEGEQAGVAFLLVTFLWPRKEKSLAPARRAGETLSRAAPSCPAWRSHAQVTQPLTLTLSRKGRGDGYRGRLRSANRPYSTLLAKPCQRGWRPITLTLSRKGRGGCLPWCNALCLLHPTPLPLGGGDCYRGRLRFATRLYSTLLDSTRPCLSRGRRKPRRGWNPRTLPRRGMPGWHPPTTLPPLAFATTMRR
jgi:hypothetical protein